MPSRPYSIEKGDLQRDAKFQQLWRPADNE